MHSGPYIPELTLLQESYKDLFLWRTNDKCALLMF